MMKFKSVEVDVESPRQPYRAKQTKPPDWFQRESYSKISAPNGTREHQPSVKLKRNAVLTLALVLALRLSDSGLAPTLTYLILREKPRSLEI